MHLNSDEFVWEYAYVATPAALYRALQRSKEVRDVHLALADGDISEAIVRAYVEALLTDLAPGEPFRHELATAAVAVALEGRSTDFADEYLTHLGKLEAAEMSMSDRVARECLERQAGRWNNDP